MGTKSSWWFHSHFYLLEFISVFFVYKCHLANQALAELFYEGLGWKLQEENDVFFCPYLVSCQLQTQLHRTQNNIELLSPTSGKDRKVSQGD